MKSIATIFSLVVFFTISLSAQTSQHDCGTPIDNSNLSRLRTLNTAWTAYKQQQGVNRAYTGTTAFVPTQIHIIRLSSGSGGMDSMAVVDAFERLNEYYIDASIHFFQCSPIRYIDNNTYYSYQQAANQVDLDSIYGVDSVFNIYFTNTVSDMTGGLVCGHADYPGGLDFAIQNKDCTPNGSTLIHEVGHYLGLYHTHETVFGAEAVDGSDCMTEGDLICDTDADPTLNSSTNMNTGGCDYYGTAVDENGATYTPQTLNIMSYSAKECRVKFTPEQTAKMHWVLQNQRAYLNCNVPPLEAFFYVHTNPDCSSSKQIDFYNAAEGDPISYLWAFGDGNTSSSESPTHTYATRGVYNVTLTVDNGMTTDSYTQTVAAGAVEPPYTNDFEGGINDLAEFDVMEQMKNKVRIDNSTAATGSTYSLCMDGVDISSVLAPLFQTPTTAAVSLSEYWNPFYKSGITLCVDASNYSNLQLEFDKRQVRNSNDKYTNMRVTVNGVMVGTVYGVNNTNTDDPGFTHITVDLSAYDGQIIKLGIEGSHKFDKDRSGTNRGSATFIDNLNITGTYVPTSTQRLIEETKSIAYPNPTQNQISIAGVVLEANEVQVFNTLGQAVTAQVQCTQKAATHLVVDLTNLTTGIYFIKAKNFVHKVEKN